MESIGWDFCILFVPSYPFFIFSMFVFSVLFMIEQFAKSRKHIYAAGFQWNNVNKKTIQYLRKKLIYGRVLDIGQASPLTTMIYDSFNVTVENTIGDLDEDFEINGSDYSFVIFSHTLEHVFNPVHCLLKIKAVMKQDAKMFIMLPRRGKLLWTKNHYHEIDHYRFMMLMKRTGFRVVGWTHTKAWRKPLDYMKGFRSFYRLFREFNITYEVEIND